MEGAHDMGGVAWSGPVLPEPDEPMFHAEWERRAFAITLAMAMPGGWNIDMSRFARENRPPQSSDRLSAALAVTVGRRVTPEVTAEPNRTGLVASATAVMLTPSQRRPPLRRCSSSQYSGRCCPGARP